MSSILSTPYNGDYYNIEYDFLDVILNDWEPLSTPVQSRTPSPQTPESVVASTIYAGMGGLFIAETDEELATEYADLANYILDKKEAAVFLKENEPIYNALLAFTAEMEKRWPAAVTLTTAMRAQLEIIAETK